MKKNYHRLFLDFCKKHEIWTCFYPDGTIDYVTLCGENYFGGVDGFIDFHPDEPLKQGSKKAYNWLVDTYKERAGEA